MLTWKGKNGCVYWFFASISLPKHSYVVFIFNHDRIVFAVYRGYYKWEFKLYKGHV